MYLSDLLPHEIKFMNKLQFLLSSDYKKLHFSDFFFVCFKHCVINILARLLVHVCNSFSRPFGWKWNSSIEIASLLSEVVV